MVMPYDAWFLDGTSAVRRQVSLAPEGESFRIVAADRTTEAIAFSDLVRLRDLGGDAVFARRGYRGWRLILPGGVPASLVAQLPRGQRRGWLRLAILALGVAAATIVFLVRRRAA